MGNVNMFKIQAIIDTRDGNAVSNLVHVTAFKMNRYDDDWIFTTYRKSKELAFNALSDFTLYADQLGLVVKRSRVELVISEQERRV